MKNLVTLCILCIGISSQAYAQASAMSSCSGIYPGGITPHPDTISGISPSDSFLLCITRGVPVSDTLYFSNYRSLTYHNIQVAIHTLTIDSIYLPNGLCWSTNKANNTFAGGENGIIYISGTTIDSAGQYKMSFIMTANTDSGAISHLNAERDLGLVYRVRIRNLGCSYLQIDNSSMDSVMIYIPYPTSYCLDTLWWGINPVVNILSNISVTPNPFSISTTVSFTSDVEDLFILKMENLLGEVVSQKKVAVTRGNNEFCIQRNGLNSGIYILIFSNDTSSVSRKVIME